MALRRKSLSTGDIARYCQVTPATVVNWIKAEKLQVYTTPGGQYRMEVNDFVGFLETNKLPIPEELQPKIFDMFFTTKEVGEGSGMGLAVAHTIVTNHGGSITLASPPGEGATFTIYLPSAQAGPGEPAPLETLGDGRRDGDGESGSPA